MQRPSLLLALTTLAACADPDFPTNSCKKSEAASCVEFHADEVDALLEAVNLLEDDAEVILGAGTFLLDNQITFRNADGVRFAGQGIDETVLDFSGQPKPDSDDEGVQANGVDFVGAGFVIEDLTISDAKKDGLRVEDSDDVVIRRVKATWSGGPSSDNGAYGLYPVKSRRVLIEDSEAWNASDAGLYVGQCQHAVVRNSLAKQNVAGLEIENTQFAEVYGNTVEDNTGGLVVFDLPGNPIVGRDIYVHDNVVRDNNRPNFAPSGTVGVIPAGTGTFILASRRVEFSGNTYENNGTVDVAILSGLALESDETQWALESATLIGSMDGLDLPADGTQVFNYETSDIVIRDNVHTGGGTLVDAGNTDLEARQLGFLVDLLYGDEKVDSVLYDAIGESAYDADDPAGNSNDHHICLADLDGGTFASLDLETLAARFENLDFATTDDLFRPPAPFTPFDCDGFSGDPLVRPDVELSE